MDRSKKKLAVFLKTHAFMTVLCMASVSSAALKINLCAINHQIPNPLFDLAGLMCGHF